MPFFAKGTCKFGDACRDKHGGSSNRSPSNDNKGKGTDKGTSKPTSLPLPLPPLLPDVTRSRRKLGR